MEVRISPLLAQLRYFSSATKPHHLQLEGGLFLVSFPLQMVLFLPSLDRVLPRSLRRYNMGSTRSDYLCDIVHAFIGNWLTIVVVRESRSILTNSTDYDRSFDS